MEGWLCPALNLYYSVAPKKLYVQVREAKCNADFPSNLNTLLAADAHFSTENLQRQADDAARKKRQGPSCYQV